MSEQMNKFTDAEGESWILRFESLDLLDAFHELGVSLEQFQNIEKINAGAMLKLAWYGCRRLARARRVTFEEFFTKRIKPSMFPQVMEAVGAAMEMAFPSEQESGGDAKADPLPPGASETSSN